MKDIKTTITKELDTDLDGVVCDEVRGSFTLSIGGATLEATLWITTGEDGDLSWMAEISHLYVPRELRRQGIARKLIEKAVEVISEEWDESAVSVRAIPEHDREVSAEDLASFYTSMGLTLRD